MKWAEIRRVRRRLGTTKTNQVKHLWRPLGAVIRPGSAARSSGLIIREGASQFFVKSGGDNSDLIWALERVRWFADGRNRFHGQGWQRLKRQRTGAVQNLAELRTFHLGWHFAGK
jgi:hypothetical protein